MNKPTWVTVVGVLAIIFGITGLLSSLQFVVMPFMIDMQRSVMETMEGIDHDAPEEVFEMYDKMMAMPEWFKSVSIIIGIIGMVIAGFYLYSAIMFITVKYNAAGKMTLALFLMIMYALVKITAGLMAGSFLAIMISISAGVSIVIDLVLLIIISASDKTIFQQAKV